MNETDLQQRYRRFIEEAWGHGDFAIVDEVIAPDIVHHTSGPQADPGAEGVKSFIRRMRAGLPDMTSTAEHEVVDGDLLIDHLTIRGTHTGDLMGCPATGRAVRFELVDINRFDDSGRIVEHWSVMDTLSLLQQIGAAPEQHEPALASAAS
jgi:predicted ester cyclase